MSIKALQEYTYISKYARYNKEAKRRETWHEACERVKEMHLVKYAEYPDVHADIEWAFEKIKEQVIVGSQRALQFGGKPVLQKESRLYNCTVSFCDRIRFFQECLWLLLCGSGTGFSVQKHHIAKLPDFHTQDILKVSKTFIVPDTIEGWSDALGVLLATYMPHPEFIAWASRKVDFNYSLIRKKGSSLSSGVGKAPGPEPLRRSLETIRDLLNKCLASGRHRLRPIDAYDIIMHASDAVLSGGVRRSATIAICSPDDKEMVTSKTGNWFTENPQRARSNNSVLLLRDKTNREEFDSIMNSVREFGEPGFIWADSTEVVLNPCCEISMWPVHEQTGESGWQMCNLTEINGKKVKTKQDFAIAARAAAIVGTLQAGYTSFPYLGKTSEEIVRREALLGVSITGMMDSPEIIFNPVLQEEMAKLVLDVNKEIANKIGINLAARATCIKPSGTTSCVLGTASGIHPHHASRYFRRVQANQMEPVFQHFKKHNPKAVEKSVWSANNTDEIITFCIDVGENTDISDSDGIVDVEKIILDRADNLAGKSVGLWTITDKYEMRAHKRYWLCRCQCGMEKWVWHGNLQSGSTKSCGCLRKRVGSKNPCWTGYGDIPGKYWSHLKCGAEERKIVFNLSIEEAYCVFKEQGGRCSYTNQVISFEEHTASLDRIDSNRPYELTNIQWVHKDINIMKGALEDTRFLELCSLIGSGGIENTPWVKTKNHINALTLLDYVKLTQQNWVAGGRRAELCTQPWLTHNVSNTINVNPDEWGQVTDFIYDNRNYFAGIALLPQSGDLDYPQAPMCAIYNSREIVKMYGDGAILASGVIVNALNAFDNNLWAACNAVLGMGTKIVEPAKPDTEIINKIINIANYKKWEIAYKEWESKVNWIRQANQFGERYFAGNIRKMTYCLKSVCNFKLWIDLNREFVDVDYASLIEEEDNTTPMQEAACAGGSCNLI